MCMYVGVRLRIYLVIVLSRLFGHCCVFSVSADIHVCFIIGFFSLCLSSLGHVMQTLFLMIYAWFVICFNVLWQWSGMGIHIVLFTLIVILAMTSHTRAQFSNPGAVPKTLVSECESVFGF